MSFLSHILLVVVACVISSNPALADQRTVDGEFALNPQGFGFSGVLRFPRLAQTEGTITRVELAYFGSTAPQITVDREDRCTSSCQTIAAGLCGIQRIYLPGFPNNPNTRFFYLCRANQAIPLIGTALVLPGRADFEQSFFALSSPSNASFAGTGRIELPTDLLTGEFINCENSCPTVTGIPCPTSNNPTFCIHTSVAANWSVMAQIRYTFTPCIADFNHDGQLTPDDLADAITCYFNNAATPGSCVAIDVNRDGLADPDDLADYISAYFRGC